MKTAYLVHLTRKARAEAAPERLVAAGLARADAQRVLRSAVPVPVAFADTKEAAAGAIRKLREAGLDGFAITAAALKRFRPTPLKRLEFRPDRLILYPGRAGLDVDPSTVRSLVMGKFHYRTEIASAGRTGPVMQAYLASYAFGLPASARGETPETVRTSTSEESFAAIFAAEAWLVREHDFDYAATLGRREPTREGSFRRVVAELRRACPRAAFDESLYRKPVHVSVEHRRGSTAGGLLTAGSSQVSEGSTEERALSAAYVIHLAGTA